MYVVFFNRPFYPSVEDEYETEAEALAAAAKLVSENDVSDGEHESCVYVAQIIKKTELKTVY